NLGVIGYRVGDFGSARDALNDALRLYTTLRNNANRLAALYNLANLALERGEAEAASSLYAETTASANQLGAADMAVGAYAGQGLAALKLGDLAAARIAHTAAMGMLGDRHDWWFQGREFLESLSIHLDAREHRLDAAHARFHQALERLEAMD